MKPCGEGKSASFVEFLFREVNINAFYLNEDPKFIPSVLSERERVPI